MIPIQEFLKLKLDADSNQDAIIKYNKELIFKYPFLLPRNRFSGQVPEDYDYSYTELDEMAPGWRIAFGTPLCDELLAELRQCDFIAQYRITQIKEKYGYLHWYDAGYPVDSRIDSILYKYEDLSFCICPSCGNVTKYGTDGWIQYICEDCYQKIPEQQRASCHLLTEVDIPHRYQIGVNGEELEIPSEIDFYKFWNIEKKVAQNIDS